MTLILSLSLLSESWLQNIDALYILHTVLDFILKLQLLQLKHSQIWLRKQLGKSGYQNASVWNIR